MSDLRGKKVTVFGLGRFGGGIGAARWLAEAGAIVTVTDEASAEKLSESVAQLSDVKINWKLGGAAEAYFTHADLIVASPAIPPHHPMLGVARSAGIEITTEIRLFVERCPATIVGVTGTKGKSTTSAMLGRILARKFTTHLGGNIGHSLLGKLPEMLKTDIVVLELSSYMLDYLAAMRFSPHIAVVTMIGIDHVEWHGSAQAYQAAKANILKFQRPDDFAVLNAHDPGAMALKSQTRGRVVPYGDALPLKLQIPGGHNQLNAQGAMTAAMILGVDRPTVQEALADFQGLPHRLQLVHTRDGVQYCNDSIATIPEAAIAALESFEPKRVIQIVGGYDNQAPIKPLCNALVERAKAVLCIGQRGPEIAEMCGAATGQSAAFTYNCGDLATAVQIARRIATAGDVVLLSPGCKSYGPYVNFEQRGRSFAIS